MTLTNLRIVNGLCVALVSSLLIFLNVFAADGGEIEPAIYLLGFVAGAMIYPLACLLEPYWVHRINRGGGRPEKLPFEAVLMQYQFGTELKEILYFEKKVQRPAFSSGHPFSPRRIYLHKGIEEKLNPQQMQGLFALCLADLALERDTKLWTAGGVIILVLLSIIFAAMCLFPAGNIPVQSFLAIIPLLFGLLDLIFSQISRHLVYLSDCHAAQVLVYPDCLLGYLVALARLESDGKEDGNSDYRERRSGLMKIFTFAVPYPSALERLRKLGARYSGTGRLY